MLLAIAVTVTLACSASGAVPAGGRAWELVTPGEPVAATMSGEPIAMDPAGNRLAYTSAGPLSGAPAGDVFATSLAVREASGWHSKPLGAPYTTPSLSLSTPFGVRFLAADDGLTSFVLSADAPLFPTAPPIALYRSQVDGGLAYAGELGNSGAFNGASADTAHVFFNSEEHLLPSDAGRTSGSSIYESFDSTLRQVDVATDGSLLSECGSSVPAGGVTASGDRVFFTQSDGSMCGGASRLYLRESGSKTVEVSASHCSRPDCNGADNAVLAGATPSGSVAFVVTGQQLTNADENSKRDLYRFEADNGSIALVSPGSIEMEGEVGGTALTSPDGETTYLRSEGGGLLPGTSAPGIYLSDADGLRPVAPSEGPMEISADGRTAVFSTTAQLLEGDDDEQDDVYLYDADADQLRRLSAGSAGGNGPFGATIPGGSTASTSQLRRAITADGLTVFFSTAEPLVAEDQNEVADVYEWSEGALGPVSSGAGNDPAGFLAASRDGTTVLFRTAASLLPGDRDGGDMDFYAARVGGGFAEAQPPTESCQRCGPAAGPLVRPEPASAARRPAGKKGRIRLRRLGEASGRSIAAAGWVDLDVSVPAPGRVSAKARGRIGGDPETIANGVGGALGPGALPLRLAFRPAARRQLIRERVLRFRLVLRQADLQVIHRISVRLDEPR